MKSASGSRWRRPHYVSILCIGLFALAACQTTGSVDGEATTEPKYKVSRTFYTPLFDQADHLKDLIKQKKLDDAAVLVEEQSSFFTQKWQLYKSDLKVVADHLSSKHTARLQGSIAALQNISWPAKAGIWPGIKTALVEAEAAVNAYPDHMLTKNAELQSPLYGQLTSLREQKKALIRDRASDAFAEFDHFSGRTFFTEYPAETREAKLVEEHFNALAVQLDRRSAEEIERFGQAIGEERFGDERWRRVGQSHFRAAVREASPSGDANLRQLLAAAKQTADAGFRIDNAPGLDIAVVETTSLSLLKGGQIEFPAEIDVDLPATLSKSDIDQALSPGSALASRYLIAFDVALAKARRRVTGSQKMPAKLLVGHNTVPNPGYNLVQNQINTARVELNSAHMNKASTDAQYCYGIGCAGKLVAQIAATAMVSEAEKKLDAAMGQLRETPQTLQEPVFRNYRYDKATVKSTRAMTVNYYVIDRTESTYFKSTFDIEEREEFQVAYGVQDNDPDRAKHLSDAHSEQDVVEWEEKPASVKLSQLVDHYLANAASVRKLPSLVGLRREMLRDKNTALAKYREQTFEGSTKADPRFESVVVVFNPDGGLGSGFFVRPDVVLTNYHVVDEKEFVEMKLRDGQETFGKVIARDLRLDLALIRVQARGKPVRIYNKRELELGSTVEVIGHPRGNEFTITRGIVSAVRKRSGPVIQTSKDIMIVQIDAATSPGNSGGPVFLNEEVVSVVSFGDSRQGSENLNFTIHYSEANRFISESLGSGS